MTALTAAAPRRAGSSSAPGWRRPRTAAAARAGSGRARTDSAATAGSRSAGRTRPGRRRAATRAGACLRCARAARRAALRCRDGAAPSKTSAAAALSTICPAYITSTRCATSATTPRSCVIRTSAMPRSRCRRSSRASICACTVTSSAVVGSSAISRRGLQAIAIASMTRWLMPPESWCGKTSRRRSASAISTSFSSCSARARRARRDPPSCRPIVSISWKATVNDGLRLVIGSWKIIAISPPSSDRRSRSPMRCRSRPANASRSARTRPGASIRPRTASAVTLLPEPDSPTMPTTSPAPTEKLTSLAACTGASGGPKSTERRSTSSSGAAATSSCSALMSSASGRARRAGRRRSG